LIKLELREHIKQKWLGIVDLISKIFNVPTTLLTRFHDESMEIIITNESEQNPFYQGDMLSLEKNLFCKKAISLKSSFFLDNARKYEGWKDVPDSMHGLISYFGIPLFYPNGRPFGTICVLDFKEKSYSEEYVELFSHFRDLIEHDINSLYMDQQQKKILEEIHAKEIQNSKDMTFHETIGALHHNINQPLSIIIGSVSLMKKKASTTDQAEQLTKHINNIESACYKIIDTMENLKKINKFQSEFYTTHTKIAKVD